jgi:phosphoribosyl 1,2-cyclic phosphodiesterase
VALGEHEHLILDAGSGLRMLGKELGPPVKGVHRRFHILLSHYHFDHIEGLPLFPPLYDRNATIRVHGVAPEGRTLQNTLETFIAPPYFPVRLSGTPARMEYVELRGEPFSIGPLEVSTLSLNHPDGCVAYRFDRGGRRVVFATDHEHGDPAVDEALASFSQGANYLIYDATYVPAEYETLRKGWGHSTWYAAVLSARTAGARHLVLFHHHPEHTDAELENILLVAQKEFPGTLVAREGMSIPL